MNRAGFLEKVRRALIAGYAALQLIEKELASDSLVDFTFRTVDRHSEVRKVTFYAPSRDVAFANALSGARHQRRRYEIVEPEVGASAA